VCVTLNTALFLTYIHCIWPYFYCCTGTHIYHVTLQLMYKLCESYYIYIYIYIDNVLTSILSFIFIRTFSIVTTHNITQRLLKRFPIHLKNVTSFRLTLCVVVCCDSWKSSYLCQWHKLSAWHYFAERKIYWLNRSVRLYVYKAFTCHFPRG